MKCYRKNGSDLDDVVAPEPHEDPSMKCYRKNGSDGGRGNALVSTQAPSMKCYRKNGSDQELVIDTTTEYLPQ